ncbi:MAG TPA: helix-turn-helix transcriptional regulator [Longimicrobium sp.]|nr:helix-turn-helix transcriptional regulator [Longimicrobium sp.]
MKGDLTLEELTAKLCENPEFAAAWAEDEPRVHLGGNVYRLRAAQGLTQLQLAEAAKMKQPRIAEIERGDGNPTLLTMTRIAIALGVAPDRLLVDPGSVADPRASADKRNIARANAPAAKPAAGKTRKRAAT